MRVLRVFIAASVMFLAVGRPCFSAEEEGFPKIGFVKNDGANVRAGDNLNFEVLYKLKKHDPVKIVNKRYSWFEIMLPKKASMYIKNDYVDLEPEKAVGVVNASRVNLRAGPGLRYSALGQVSEPETLDVISEKDDWYEIERPKGTTGWIHTSQVGFSCDILK